MLVCRVRVIPMGRRLMILLAVAAAVMLAPLSAPDRAAALTCGYQPPKQKFEQADAAIVASVVEASGPVLSAQIRFRVLEVHKGAQFQVGQEVTAAATTYDGLPKPGAVLGVLLRYISDPGWGIWFTSLDCGFISIDDLRRVSAERDTDEYIPRGPVCACGPPTRGAVRFIRWPEGRRLPLRRTLARGPRFIMACRPACRYGARLWLDADAARQAGLGKGLEPVVVARAIGRLAGPRPRTIAIRFTKQAKKRLAHRRRVQLTLKGTVAPGSIRFRGTLTLRRPH